MREIKFRAKHSIIGTWYYGCSNPKEERNELELSLFWQQVECGILDVNTVGQYIGLKDKNGKEIYEGDLVKVSSGDYWLEVVYDAPKFKLKDNFGEWHMNPVATQTHYEVIGNIKENLELMEK